MTEQDEKLNQIISCRKHFLESVSVFDMIMPLDEEPKALGNCDSGYAMIRFGVLFRRLSSTERLNHDNSI